MNLEIIYLEKKNTNININLKIYKSTDDLKEMLDKYYKIPVQNQLWFQNNIILKSNLLLNKNSNFSVFIKDNLIKIQIILPNNFKKYLPLINKNIIIDDLIKLVENKFNLKNIAIYFENNKMKNNSRLNNYDIEKPFHIKAKLVNVTC